MIQAEHELAIVCYSNDCLFMHYPGNIVALLHSFFSNLPQEWLEGAHVIIKHLRPITSVAMLRIAFRIMGPLLPRLANAHSLFNKVKKVIPLSCI